MTIWTLLFALLPEILTIVKKYYYLSKDQRGPFIESVRGWSIEVVDTFDKGENEKDPSKISAIINDRDSSIH